jgi:hypothetical protein
VSTARKPGLSGRHPASWDESRGRKVGRVRGPMAARVAINKRSRSSIDRCHVDVFSPAEGQCGLPSRRWRQCASRGATV